MRIFVPQLTEAAVECMDFVRREGLHVLAQANGPHVSRKAHPARAGIALQPPLFALGHADLNGVFSGSLQWISPFKFGVTGAAPLSA